MLGRKGGLALGFALSLALSTAAAAAPHDGIWWGRYVSAAGLQREVRLSLQGLEGSWTPVARNAGDASINPCNGREHPVDVQVLDTNRLRLFVNGNTVFQGCTTLRLELSQQGEALVGELRGLPLRFSRTRSTEAPAVTAAAEPGEPPQGRWRVGYRGRGGGAREAELDLQGDTGWWRSEPKPSDAAEGCHGLRLPVTLAAEAEGWRLDIHADRVKPACRPLQLRLQRRADGGWTGEMQGAALRLLALD